jgi:hypothetical protein
MAVSGQLQNCLFSGYRKYTNETYFHEVRLIFYAVAVHLF